MDDDDWLVESMKRVRKETFLYSRLQCWLLFSYNNAYNDPFLSSSESRYLSFS